MWWGSDCQHLLLFVQRHFGNQSRLEAENYYDKAFAYLQQPTKISIKSKTIS